jgi:alanyl-tRNA synthetase
MANYLIPSVREAYRKFCEKKGIPFEEVSTVDPYDDSTLFCPAGMQRFKPLFSDESHTGTQANIQSCIRMNDFDELSDRTHRLSFDMIGLFSFREMSVREAVEFFLEFLGVLGLEPDYATVHPDRAAWATYYLKHGVQTKFEQDCTWSDGSIGGYCTEFFIDDVEVGNIVNPLGTCIDVGFGLERLQHIVNVRSRETFPLVQRVDKLCSAARKIIESGYKPGPVKQGYVLRKILREILGAGGSLDHPYFEQEVERQKRTRERYEALREKHADKPKEWWYDTHGINVDEL